MEINANLMENDFRIKKINGKEEVEFHNEGNERDLDTVGDDNWNKFISTLDAKKFKTEQNWADTTSDSDNVEDELEIL